MEPETKISPSTWFLLLFLWILLTTINLCKAWHIDDTFHLEAAQWIAGHPFQPMSGQVNWDQQPEPLHHFNQPPLYFFLLAAVIKTLGDGPVTLHLFQSLFAFAALWFFVKIAQTLALRHIRLLLFFFALNPAFIVNQNLMTDIPLLSFVLAFTWFLLKGGETGSLKYYGAAALTCGLACLIKYTALPLVPALLLCALLRRHYRALLWVLLPIAMLSGWSMWNYLEYGGVHLTGREAAKPQFKHILDFLNCLGAVSLFSVPFVVGILSERVRQWFVRVTFLLSATFLIAIGAGFLNLTQTNELLNLLFTLNGSLLILALLIVVFRKLKTTNNFSFTASPWTALMIITAGLIAFIVLFAPFIATRHLLLVIPFLLFAGDELIDKLKPGLIRITVAITAIFGLAMGISDWLYADYYRHMARTITLPDNSSVWYAGHWGWQKYASERGWRQYDCKGVLPGAGSYLLYPGVISRQAVDLSQLKLIEKKFKVPSAFSYLSGVPGRMYSSGIDFQPWQLSTLPVDTIYIYKVEAKTP